MIKDSQLDLDPRTLNALLKLHEEARLKVLQSQISNWHDQVDNRPWNDYPWVEAHKWLLVQADLSLRIARKLRYNTYLGWRTAFMKDLQPLVGDHVLPVLDQIAVDNYVEAAQLVLADPRFLDSNRVKQSVHLRAELLIKTHEKLMELFPSKEEVVG